MASQAPGHVRLATTVNNRDPLILECLSILVGAGLVVRPQLAAPSVPTVSHLGAPVPRLLPILIHDASHAQTLLSSRNL